MKLNWGTSIVIAMTLFIGFIMYMVITMTTQKAYDHDLVVEEYYKKEMTLNDKLQKIENGKLYATDIKFNANPNGLLLSFPEELKSLSEANIFAYRASDKALDFNSSITLNSQGEALVNRPLARGLWEFTLAFTYQDKDYLITKSANIQ
ncbi:FixH family protein [Mesohalobacter halotolerans]|jgi:hypothetical protein|uniref:Cytochrome C oxidase Cbb3 n=1 Tax=Mesohalobacter halotolerans TaxID=1883405 RepID=A0A4U5TRC1_9FLAO|nr:FixH family protein [Mesohalobacter halotolerans]MBS3739245.1 FixH family protein [Psychroflexus sp.]NBC57960.1 cytochrome C oxidase Cbb3 [Bacteroidota bacterium]TKS56512.1 cytochrome C oxidase Cbb3 [Mesohalobacter halotolerans]